MASLQKRMVFQVLPNPPNERTLTLSSTTKNGHFISIRPFIKPSNDEEKAFPFEWAFAGTSASAKATKKDERTVGINFNFQFDTNVYLQIPNTHRGEIKTLWKDWDSGCVEETGKVYPFGADGEAFSFLELWQPVDPTRDEFVILPNGSKSDINAKSIALSLKNDEFEGLIIIVGKWCQGILFKKNDGTVKGINFIRAIQRENGKWENLLKFGPDFDKFPSEFHAKEGSTVVSGGVSWEVIESNL